MSHTSAESPKDQLPLSCPECVGDLSATERFTNEEEKLQEDGHAEEANQCRVKNHMKDSILAKLCSSSAMSIHGGENNEAYVPCQPEAVVQRDSPESAQC